MFLVFILYSDIVDFPRPELSDKLCSGIHSGLLQDTTRKDTFVTIK